jgi:hypothetical protein
MVLRQFHSWANSFNTTINSLPARMRKRGIKDLRLPISDWSGVVDEATRPFHPGTNLVILQSNSPEFGLFGSRTRQEFGWLYVLHSNRQSSIANHQSSVAELAKSSDSLSPREGRTSVRGGVGFMIADFRSQIGLM